MLYQKKFQRTLDLKLMLTGMAQKSLEGYFGNLKLHMKNIHIYPLLGQIYKLYLSSFVLKPFLNICIYTIFSLTLTEFVNIWE